MGANRTTDTFTTPVSANQFRLGINGLYSTKEQMHEVDGLDSLEFSLEGTVQEYFTTLNGYNNADKTAIKGSFSFSGKRVVGDKANDFIARTGWYLGKKAKTIFDYTFDDGSVIEGKILVNTSKISGGAAEDLNALEGEFIIDGKPNVKQLVNIEVTKGTTSYTVGTAIDISDVKVMATYSDGTTADVSNKAVVYENGIDILTAGSYEMPVEYANYNQVITIEVTEVAG